MVIKGYYDLYNPLYSLLVYHITNGIYIGEDLENYDGNQVAVWWSRGTMLAFGIQVHGFKPGRSRRIFRAKKSSARLPSERK
jgi:hypothetical protein